MSVAPPVPERRLSEVKSKALPSVGSVTLFNPVMSYVATAPILRVLEVRFPVDSALSSSFHKASFTDSPVSAFPSFNALN